MQDFWQLLSARFSLFVRYLKQNPANVRVSFGLFPEEELPGRQGLVFDNSITFHAAISLRFLAGALGYWDWQRGAWPVWFPALVFSPFIADATVTLLRPLAPGEKFWQAHR